MVILSRVMESEAILAWLKSENMYRLWLLINLNYNININISYFIDNLIFGYILYRCILGLVSLFNDLSTFMSYLMPTSSFQKYDSGTIQPTAGKK